MEYKSAESLAQSALLELSGVCSRVKICGSIRRKDPNPNDVDIVCIPKRIVKTDMFDNPDGDEPIPPFIKLVSSWPKIIGDPHGRYTRRLLNGIVLELSIVRPENWGYMVVIRTGPAEFSHRIAKRWVKMGYQGQDGMLTCDGQPVAIREEDDLFRILGLEYIEPCDRK